MLNIKPKTASFVTNIPAMVVCPSALSQLVRFRRPPKANVRRFLEGLESEAVQQVRSAIGVVRPRVEPQGRFSMNRMTKDEARRIAPNAAKLPNLIAAVFPVSANARTVTLTHDGALCPKRATLDCDH